MFCPHCNNRIPDGSNICPLCYANLAGVKSQAARSEQKPSGEQMEKSAAQSQAPRPRKKSAYTKGSRGSRKKSADRTPMIIAFGLIVILIIIIAMIITSMFGAGDSQSAGVRQNETQQPINTPGSNFVVFGATPTPTARPQFTPTPAIEVTPTPAPAQPASYATLRKGDQGREVVTLQQALAELGYLSGAADGNFGTGTQTAVKKFQEDHGLDADGIAGKLTQEALFSIATVTPIPETTVGPGDIMDLPG